MVTKLREKSNDEYWRAHDDEAEYRPVGIAAAAGVYTRSLYL